MDRIVEIGRWDGKHLDEIPITELSDLRFILENMPVDIEIDITAGDMVYESIEEYIQERTEQFFDVKEEDYKKITGTCFMNADRSVAVKVVGIRDDYDDPYYKTDHHVDNFLFEKFERYSDGSWHIQKYNWLQETAKGEHPDEKYLKWCLTSETDMNIGSESMFHLGKDSNLYVDITCGGDYDIYKPISSIRFELIKSEALENDGEYKVR